MPIVTLTSFTLTAENPTIDLSSYFAPGAQSAIAIPDAVWELKETTTTIIAASGGIVTNPGGETHNSVFYPFGTMYVSFPTVAQTFNFNPPFNPPNQPQPSPWFNKDTKFTVFDPAYSSLSFELNAQYDFVICWRLCYALADGRLRALHGPGRYPSIIEVPDPDAQLSSCVLVEDGEVVPSSMYEVCVGKSE